MQAKDKYLSEIIGRKDNIFTIPSYQRKYKWKFKEEVMNLLSDIEQFIIDLNDKTKKRQDYFLGSIVTKINGGINVEYILVDGQQRITTFLLIASAIKEIVKNNSDNKLRYRVETLLESDENKFKLNRINDEIIVKKIVTGQISLITEDEKKTQYYNVFDNLIKYFKYNYKDIKKLEDFFVLGLTRIKLAVISLEEYEDEFLVYESINSKGMSLTSGDLIKNFLMMQMRNDEDLEKKLENEILSQFDEQKLEDFFRQLISLKTKKLATKSNKNLYHAFIKEWNNNDINYEFVEWLRNMSLIWKYIFDDSNFGHLTYPVMKSQLLNYYGIIHSLIFKNSTYDKSYNSIKINEEQKKYINDSLIKLSSVVIRRTLYGRGRVESNRTFAKIGSEYFNSKNVNFEDEIIKKMINAEGNVRTPSWDETEAQIEKVDIFSSSSQILKWALIALEEEMTKNKLNSSDISIEHIYPQKPSSDWKLSAIEELEMKKMLNTLGNLTIVDKRVNSSLGNKIFEEKKILLENKTYLKINKSIYEAEIWNPLEVKIRAKKMVGLFKEIWK